MCEDTRACAWGGDGPTARGTRACAEGLARLWRPQDGRLLTWMEKRGQCSKPCQHRHVFDPVQLCQPVLRGRRYIPRVSDAVLRPAAARRVSARGQWPMANRLGKAWKGPSCRRKGLRQATYYEHTQTCTCGHVCVALCFFVAVLMCLCLLGICVFLFAFLCLVVCLSVCLCCVFGCFVLCGSCLLHASVSWAEQ